MHKTLICYLVEQYLLGMKEDKYDPLDMYSAARAGGNHNRVNIMTKNYRGFFYQIRKWNYTRG